MIDKASETYRLLACESVEFMNWCLSNQHMTLKDIQNMYLNKKLVTLSYSNVLQQLITEHIHSHVNITKEVCKND